jgi:ABC-type sugar transport system substrate-binding protein
MRKRILPVVVSGVMVAGLLAGCGSSSSTSGSSSASSESGASSASSASSASESATTSATSTAATSGSTEEYTTDKEYSIDVILKTTSSEYWKYVEAGAKSYATDYPNIKVDVKGATSETAYDEQQNMIETDLNADGYDGFVIAPLQADLVANLIKGKTAPIVAVDTNIEADEVLSFVGTSNEDAAKMGGEAAVAAAKEAGWDKIQAICISGVQGDSTATARLTGYEKGINGAGGEFLKDEIQYADAVADKATNSMEAVIQNHPEGIAIICANNDDMAMAAARAAAGNEAYKNTIFIGFDGIQSACKAILNGEETMSVAQEAYAMGRKSVEAVVKALDGNTLDKFIDSGCEVIDKSNAQKRLDALQGYIS